MHRELCELGAKWLTKSCKERCPVVFAALVAMSNERPDVIGFNHMHSVVIEAKVSRSDFLADKKKPFRAYPELGCGDFRLYLSPEGILKPEDMPDKWGLLWLIDRKVMVIKDIFKGYVGSMNPNRFPEKNHINERRIMYSALRRK